MDDSKTGRLGGLWRFVIAAVVACFMTPSVSAQDVSRVYLAGGERTAQELVRSAIQARFDDQLSVAAYSDQTPEDALVITLGPGALSEVRANSPNQPVIALFVPSISIADGDFEDDGRLTAVFNDPPPVRQARLGELIIPGAQQVAILASPNRASDYEGLMAALEAEGLSARVFVVPSSDQLIRTLSRALSYGDFILGTIDDEIYNRNTIKHLLLTSYRRNRLVIGPSRAYVQAGSVASTYASSQQQIEHGLSALATFRDTGELPDSDYPPDFRVSVNEQVARSMNIPVPSEDQLQDALQKREVDK